MAHKIEQIDLDLGAVERHNEESVSWHKLEDVRHGLSVENCGLREVDVQAADCILSLNGERIESNLSVPVCRNKTNGKLITLGKPYESTYQLFTPAQFVDFAGECFKAAGLDSKIAFTTTLFEGRRMTLAKHIPEADFNDAHGHGIKSYFNLLNSMDGTWPLFANISEVRTVCFNTATCNLSEGGSSVRHTPDALSAFIKRFPQTFADALAMHGTSANDYLIMADLQFNASRARHVLSHVLSTGNKLSSTAANLIDNKLIPLFVRGRGCYGQSAADVYNAVTEHYTHTGTLESNEVGGTSDKRKQEVKKALLSDKLPEYIEHGEKMYAESLVR